MNEHDAETRSNEIVSFGIKWSSADKNKLHPAAQQLSDLVENNLVANWSAFAPFHPVILVLVAVVKDLFKRRTTFLNRVENVLVNPKLIN